MGYTLIASQVLSASAASITFSSIPQTYKSLKLISSIRSSSGGGQVFISFNGSSANLTRRNLYGNGASAASASASDGEASLESDSTYTANTFSNNEVTIPNYSGATNKAVTADAVNENNSSTAYQALEAVLWSQTAAITSVTMTSGGLSFVAGSSFYLYGIS